MKTVFLGTSEFAAQVLARLASSQHRPELVLTRPDRPRGRGRKLAAPPVVQTARDLGIEVTQPDSVNDPAAHEAIAAAQPDAVCVCAYGGLIKKPLLSSYWMLNVHPSLLPRWRGAAPIERAIMAGDEATGVSIMQMTAGLDTGPVCLQTPEPILPHDTFGTLAPRLAGLGGELLVAALSDRPSCRDQAEDLVTYAEKIAPEDRWLDPGRDVRELERVVRALNPHVGAYAELQDGQRVSVLEVRAVEAEEPDQPGLGVEFSGPVPILRCRDGWLELLTVKPPGRREMTGEDWLRGLRR